MKSAFPFLAIGGIAALIACGDLEESDTDAGAGGKTAGTSGGGGISGSSGASGGAGGTVSGGGAGASAQAGTSGAPDASAGGGGVAGFDAGQDAADSAGSAGFVDADSGSSGCPAGQHIVSSGACKPILFSDDFEDGVVSPEWLLWRKTFFETGGELEVGDQPRPGFNYGHSGSGRDAIVVTHIGDSTWTDYRLDLDVQVKPPGSYNPYGLPDCARFMELEFRVQQSNENWNLPAETYYGIGINPYPATCSTGSPPQYVGLGTIHGKYLAGSGCCIVADGSERSLLQTTSAALVDGPNHYAIEVVSNNIKLWINDAAVFDYTDNVVPYAPGASPILYGGISVRWIWEVLGWVDNVVVTSLK